MTVNMVSSYGSLGSVSGQLTWYYNCLKRHWNGFPPSTHVCIAGVTLDTELLARSQYSEGPATGHLDTDISWFPCVYKQMLRRLPTFQVVTTCFSCSPPDLNLNLSVRSFIFCLHVK
jgi:hypothetical protein